MSTLSRPRRPEARPSRSRLSCGFAVFAVFLSLSSSGCLTIDRLTRFTEEPQLFGGTRSHIYPSSEDYHQEISLGSGLEWADPIVRRVVWGVDLPLSLVGDTLLLPVTIPHEILRGRDVEPPELAKAHARANELNQGAVFSQ